VLPAHNSPPFVLFPFVTFLAGPNQIRLHQLCANNSFVCRTYKEERGEAWENFSSCAKWEPINCAWLRIIATDRCGTLHSNA